ncbi:MAG: phenylalanine--tRNA ligase subunit alpha [Candidatus Magasanikbacteria bacterium]|nr:phenylalanine--tRNA ligase subunit alpha [Candidatus Magasanikbacteria bacterium]
MKKVLESLKEKFISKIKSIKDKESLKEFEINFFGRKAGEFTNLMKKMKDMELVERKEFGQLANLAKKELMEIFVEKKDELQKLQMDKVAEKERIDVTQPFLGKKRKGHLNPNTIVQKSLEDLFISMGFMVLDGPELESEYYNFEALNVPADHPARDMQDTFYIKDNLNWVMRTQTSSVQVRAMQKYGAPLRMIAPGICFRNEATDARHEHSFYQLEGLVVGKDINFSNLKGTLEVVAKHLYGDETQVRLRPKFYPFVEPGVNGEVSCFLCKGEGCRVCKKTGWLEVFGAGMVHPNVLKAGGIDPEVYSGFAFGFGLYRLVMLKYMIEDVRAFSSGNLKFLKQF